MTDARTLIDAGKATQEEALAAFDALAPADTAFMLGTWTGSGLHTGHVMDGMLEIFGWYGKEFINANHVHPLLFDDGKGGAVALEPRWFATALAKPALAKSPATARIFALLKPIMKARRTGARLRMTEYRGKSSATMIYDCLPINDVFRKVDDRTVLGVMDLKGVEQPFFFVLTRAG